LLAACEKDAQTNRINSDEIVDMPRMGKVVYVYGMGFPPLHELN
jgi:hypothetical protein